MLRRPDLRTQEALKRLRTDPDFAEIRAWLTVSLADIDQKMRSTGDAVLLRQQQGAAQVIAEAVEYAEKGGVLAAIAKRTVPEHPVDR